MADIRVVGFDPSLRNWGLASGLLCKTSGSLHTVERLELVQPSLPKGKQVRQNSKDLEAAFQLSSGAVAFAKGAQAIFVEVPVGSQSSRAMASYGICCGVLGALRAQGIPFFEVTPTEVKLAAVNSKTATKQDMINWAMDQYPDAPWPLYKKNGFDTVSEAKAEHMADAVAAIVAGAQTNEFQNVLRMLG